MANKKINQLVSKTAILSTDIFGIGDATTGQLFKKTIAELQAAIGGAVISVNGLVGTVVLDTDDIQELATPTNKWFTDVRARSAISLTVTGNSGASTYSSATGILNVPTYTLTGLGGITAGFLSGTSGISYNSTTGVISYTGTVYTDASIRALVSAGAGLTYNSSTGVFTSSITQYTDALARLSLSAGTGISYSNTTGVITSTITQYTDALARASISAGTGISYSSGTGIIASTITQYTDALARASISLTTTGNSGASTYNSTTGVLNVPAYTLIGLGGITATFLSGTSGISYNSTTGVISYSGTVYTDASIRALFSGGTGISYNSSTGAISYSGTVYTDSSVRALISMTTTGTSGASTYNNTTGVINVPNYTLAGLGGISLTSLSGGTGITYNSSTGAISYSGTVYTDASIRALFSGSTGITYNSSTGAISYSGTVYTDASVRALISATGNISYNSTTGVISTSLTQYTDALARASVSLTTTGTSGNATYNSTTGVLNVPNYGTALSGYLPLTGGTLTGALSGTSATFSGNFGIGSPPTQAAQFDLYGGDQASLLTYSGFGNRAGSDFLINSYRLPGGNLFQRVSDVVSLGDDTNNRESIFRFITTNTSNSTATRLTISGSEIIASVLSTFVGGATLKGVCKIFSDTTSAGVVLQGYTGALRIAVNGSEETGGTRGDLLAAAADFSSTLAVTGAATILSSVTATAFIPSGATVPTNGMYLSAANTLNFATASTERILITSTGNILLGTSSDNGERLYVSGAIRATGTITANSDLTLKKNLLKIENALEKVEQINGYTYEFKEDDSKRHAGVIAQEIQTVLPEIVNKGNDGILGVEYGNISALLIEAIKEQQTQINELKALLNK